MTDLKRETVIIKEQEAKKDEVVEITPPIEAYENINAPDVYPDGNGAFCPQAPRE